MLDQAPGADKPPERIAIIGAGRVGRALLQGFIAAGNPILAILDLDPEQAGKAAKNCNPPPAFGSVADLQTGLTLLLLCVPDGAINELAWQLARTNKINPDCVVAHTSGALSSAALAPLRLQTELLASLHPIQTFAGQIEDWKQLPGTFFTGEGHEIALLRLEKLVKKLDGEFAKISPDLKAHYHLACVLVSNYLVTLFSAAIEILRQAGFEETKASAMLKPLMMTTVENIVHFGASNALTGPIARGDAVTVAHHLRVIQQNFPELLNLYSSLARRALDLVQKKGDLSNLSIQQLNDLLYGFGRNASE